MVRPLQLATILAFGIGRRLQGVMGTALAATGGGDFLFRYCHSFTFSSRLLRDITVTKAGPARAFFTKLRYTNNSNK
jgi:hypothetical protein